MRFTFYTRGFTLIETLVVAALTAIVTVALGGLIQYFYKTNAYVLEQTQATESARRSIESAMADLREASYGADGSYPLMAAATSSVTFYANIDSDTAIERVRYYLSGTTLYRGTTKASGNPPSYAGQPEVATLVVDNIRNGTSTLFSYFDSAGNQLSDPINISLVASAKARVMTDVNPNRAPEIFTLTGNATLRNVRSTIKP
ncbi:type II secretion system protein [Candidatus Kaiserbacteria bacterium]|nr:type II secretion system protein [Candidatus Kaiserbacteria bacterium]